MGELEIVISLIEQRLVLRRGQVICADFPVSTAARGAGEQQGSGCTPRGRHTVRARIGAGLPRNAVLVGRRATGECYTPQLAAAFPERDWILTRILWLSGCEPGHNRLGNVDSMRRYIYIHGTPDSEPLGVPGSHGCVRMANDAIIALFDLTPAGTPVILIEQQIERYLACH